MKVSNRAWREQLQGQLPADWAQEIDVFETEIELRKAGKLDEKVFAETRLRRGTYGQRYDNGQRWDGETTQALAYPNDPLTKGPNTVWDAPGMQRIKVPFGGLNARQLEVMAELAEEYSDAILHVTTRQDIQLHFIHIEDTPTIMRRLAAVNYAPHDIIQQLARDDEIAVAEDVLAMSSLLEILAITARADARNEVLKELERHAAVLREFQARPGVDSGRLRSLLSNITRLRNDLGAAGGNFMAPLRDSEFLSAVKHRSTIPGGTCDFDLPEYSYWLHRPGGARTAEFNGWLAIIRPLCDAVSELLWLTRENARPRNEVAAGGAYQIQFDREIPCQLVRIALDPRSDLYPEISGNQHRCTVHFLRWTDPSGHPQQVEADVPFVLTLCT